MIRIVDTTLRDGEQTPGVAFSRGEKLAIARMLDAAGVHCIEAGTPAMGHEEKEAVRGIIELGLKAEVVTWNRAVIADVAQSLEIGAKNIHISLPVSDLMIGRKLRKDRAWVLEQLRTTAAYAVDHGAVLSIGMEDASRADMAFIIEFARAAAASGACRVRYCDTVGVMDPFTLKERMEALAAAVPVALEVHTHNDFGLATANAIAGINAGATYVDSTVMGLAERAGNAPLEEVVMALTVIIGLETGIRTTMLRELAEYVAQAAARPLPPGKSIVGAQVFAHESGIHVDGVIKDPSTYEPFAPEMVGARRAIVIGKHSGSAAVLHRLHELGIDPAPGESAAAVERIRHAACAKKGGLTDKELYEQSRRQ